MDSVYTKDVCGDIVPGVVEKGLGAFHKDKMSSQEMQLNTIL